MSFLHLTAVTNEVPMSDGLREPNPQRHGHRAHRERNWRWMSKERLKDGFQASQRKGRKKSERYAITFIGFAAFPWPIWKPLSRPPSRRRKRCPEPGRHHDRLPFCAFRLTTPKSPLSRTTSPTRSPTDAVENDNGLGGIGANVHGAPHTGFDHTETPRDSDDNYHGPPGYVLSDTPDSDHGHDGNVSEALSGLDTYHEKDLNVAASSDLEEEFTASHIRPHSQWVQTTGLQQTSADRDLAKHCRHGPLPPQVTLDADGKVTVADSDEDDARDHHIAPQFSHETSDSDESKDSGLRAQEENVCQVTTSLSQVAKMDLDDTPLKSYKNWGAPPSASLLDPSEGEQVEDSLNAATRQQGVAHLHLGGTSPFLKDGNLTTGHSGDPTDIPSEDDEGIDDDLGQGEEYTSIFPQTSPDESERASTNVPAVHSLSLEDVIGPGDSTTELATNYSAVGTETPDPLPQSSSLAKPFLHTFLGLIVWSKSEADRHPYVITWIDLDESGNILIWVCPCTSRPKLWKLREQYDNTDLGIKHFIYLGGERPNPKGYVTGGISTPTVPEVDFQGPQMPLYTYLQLEEHGPFDLRGFEIPPPHWRQLTPSSMEEVWNQCKPNGCKKESYWERPRRATGNTHVRTFM